MHTYRLTLAYEGIDFEDDELIDRLAGAVPNVHWMVAEGEVRALVYLEAATAREAADQAVSEIRQLVPAARATRVVEDFVSIPDIAERAGVNRETVRTWVTGSRGPGNFPIARGVVGNGIRVWDWAVVNLWLRRHYELGDDARYPTMLEVAHLNEWLTTQGLQARLTESSYQPDEAQAALVREPSTMQTGAVATHGNRTRMLITGEWTVAA